MNKYEVGTVIANTREPGWNPYVLTADGWIEVSRDGNFQTEETNVVSWLDDDAGWSVIYKARPEPEPAFTA